jgi:hypothetical protein
MEQRSEVRFAIDQPVAVVVLGGKEFRETARVKNVSPAGLQLMLDHFIPTGSAIKIELDNAIALGEVVYCNHEGQHSLVGVRLEHVLNGLAELNRKLMEFAEEPIEPPPVPSTLR